MSDLKVCRICLCKDVKMYSYDRFHLNQYYEEVLAKKINKQDGLPNWFCYECAAMLYKFHKFKEKCHRGEQALNKLLWNGPITLSSISQIDRQSINLKSSINKMQISKRIRTCIVKSKRMKMQQKEDENDNRAVLKTGESDSSMDSKNSAEINTEVLVEKEECKMSEQKINNDFEIEILVDDDHTFDDNEEMKIEEFNDFKIVKEESEIGKHVKQQTEDKSITKNVNKSTTTKADKSTTKEDNKKNKAKEKSKMFEVKKTTNDLDPNHWVMVNLSEEEALEEFRERAKDQKYLSAAYRCTDCYKRFSKEDILNRHLKLRHGESVGPAVCRFCQMRFRWKSELSAHITQHYTKYKCLRCDLVCTLKSTALFHNDYHNGVIRKCMHCGDEFRHLSSYYTHLRSHRSEHVCTLCGESFVSHIGLNKHKKLIHCDEVVNVEEKEVNTHCSLCDIKFETKTAYEQHLRHSAKHYEVIKDLACETPTASIPGRKTKKKIARIVTPCEICNINFPSRVAYNKHHATEHKDVPGHTLAPRGICEICGALIVVYSMAIHMNTHTREVMYPCAICNMKFNSKASRTRHQTLTHSEERPVACTLCDKRFKQVCSMKLHYRTFHLKEPYPKRNRKKKTDEMSKGDSDDNIILDFYAPKF